MTTASDYMRGKQSVPSDMRTAQWDAVSAWCKERAFFMASVTSAEHLQAFRSAVQQMVDGTMSGTDARKLLRMHLQGSGYQAPTGLEGTIKDLSTTARLKVTLDTNVAMARGWAQMSQFKGDIAHPGIMLYRDIRPKGQPRPWIDICRERVGNMPGVVLTGNPDEPMVALSNSPAWTMISRFGQPYPPYDYNSGMRIKPVSLDDCIDKYHLIDEDDADTLAAIEQDRMPALNDGTSCTPQVSERALREELTRQLQGLAEWQGDKLVMTDPNGTRPYSAARIGEVITASLPAGLPNLQADALRAWVEDHTQFNARSQDHVGLDMIEDLGRLFRRILPGKVEDTGTVYRGMTLPDADLARIEANGYTVRPGKVADSWGMTETASGKYLKEQPASGRTNVMLVMESGRVRPIQDAVRAVGNISSPNPAIPLVTDAEAVTLPGQRFRVVRRREDKDGTVYLYVREEAANA